MDIYVEMGTNVISPPRVTNIPRSLAALTFNLEENEPEVLEASRIDYVIKAQPIASTSVLSQPTYLLPSAIKSKLVGTDLTRIRTLLNTK